MKGSYLIKSENRSALSTSSSNFTITIAPNVVGAKHARLKYVSIPNTIYNVQANVNNAFAFNDPGKGSIAFTIPPGMYNIANLTSTLSNLMTINGSQTYSMTYNPATFIITISATNVFSLNLNVQYSCASLIGFPHSTSSAGLSQVGSSAISLQTSSIYIYITEFVNQLYCNNTQFTYMIPFGSNSGSVCQYYENNNFPQCTKLPNQPIYNLTIALYDENRNLINLNGSEWEMLIEFE